MVTTKLIIYKKIIRVKLTVYGDITTQSEANMEYIRNDKQYYLSSMEYTFCATNSEGVNSCVLWFTLDFFHCNALKHDSEFSLCYFKYFDLENNIQNKLQYYALLTK